MSDLSTGTFSTSTSFGIDWDNTQDGSVPGGGIDAIDQHGKRRTPGGSVRSLDDEVPDRKRQRVAVTSRNVSRNFELAAWAIRKHLDFVSSFGFKMSTGNKSFDRDVEGFVEWWSRANNFDASGRHGIAKSIRLAESTRCEIGDVAFVKMADGRTQAIEGDRIKTPDQHRTDGGDFDRERTFNGVETSKSGRPLRYAIHSRKRGGGLKFERWIRRRNIAIHGFFDRFDQVRGFSPIVASLNRFQDVYENFDYALGRAKVSQLFGLVFTRDVDETGLGERSSKDADGDDVADTPGDIHSAKLGTKPWLLDMNPGEDAKFLENKTPAPEFQAFSSMMIGVALKSLDIPFSFYDESFTNFFGSKAALTLYLQSVREKRADVVRLLTDLTIWRLRLAIEDGDIVLPRSIKTIDDLKFSWTAAGIPWFDPRDIRGDVEAVAATLKTRTQIRRERYGDDWRDVVDELAEEEALLKEKGLQPAPIPAANDPKDAKTPTPADEKDGDEEEDETTKTERAENEE